MRIKISNFLPFQPQDGPIQHRWWKWMPHVLLWGYTPGQRQAVLSTTGRCVHLPCCVNLIVIHWKFLLCDLFFVFQSFQCCFEFSLGSFLYVLLLPHLIHIFINLIYSHHYPEHWSWYTWRRLFSLHQRKFECLTWLPSQVERGSGSGSTGLPWTPLFARLPRSTADLGLCDLPATPWHLLRVTAASSAGDTTVVYRVATPRGVGGGES